MQQIIQDADVVWLASSWQLWQANLLKESVDRLEHDFGQQVVVFGRKNFGRIDLDEILATDVSERPQILNQLEPMHVEVNSVMKALLGQTPYIDLSDLLCNSDTHCRVIDSSGNLISPDGGHLTQSGARVLGQRLKHHHLIRPLLKSF